MANILDVKNATIRFGGLTAVNKVTLQHTGGEILALIGPNGAGKTTFFNLLTGVYQPDEGEIIFCGQDITRMKPYERVNVGIARTFQNIRLFSDLTALENLLIAHPKCRGEGVWKSVLAPGLMKKTRGEVVDECLAILEGIGLLDQQKTLSTSLPYGKQRLLEIGRALATNPKLILLDEPGAGMNPVEKAELTQLVYKITREYKKHILFIEHDMKFVMNLAERIIVLDHGEQIAEGNPAIIQANQKVVEAYLGRGKKAIEEIKAAVREGGNNNAEN